MLSKFLGADTIIEMVSFSIFKLSRTNLDGIVWYSLACVRLALNPGSLASKYLTSVSGK